MTIASALIQPTLGVHGDHFLENTFQNDDERRNVRTGIRHVDRAAHIVGNSRSARMRTLLFQYIPPVRNVHSTLPRLRDVRTNKHSIALERPLRQTFLHIHNVPDEGRQFQGIGDVHTGIQNIQRIHLHPRMRTVHSSTRSMVHIGSTNQQL